MSERKDNIDLNAALGRMAWLCSRREYCSGDICKKLRSMGIEGNDMQSILKSLQDGGYLDDARYAKAFARDKALISGWGSRKIIFALKAKGLPSEVVDPAVAEAFAEDKADRRMREVVERKWASLRKEEERVRVAKTLRYATGRGYGYEEVMAVIRGLDALSED